MPWRNAFQFSYVLSYCVGVNIVALWGAVVTTDVERFILYAGILSTSFLAIWAQVDKRRQQSFKEWAALRADDLQKIRRSLHESLNREQSLQANIHEAREEVQSLASLLAETNQLYHKALERISELNEDMAKLMRQILMLEHQILNLGGKIEENAERISRNSVEMLRTQREEGQS